MRLEKIGSARCADCERTHDIGRHPETSRLVQLDPCVFPLACMDCERAYDTSRVRGSTGLCMDCLIKRKRRREARDASLKRDTSRE